MPESWLIDLYNVLYHMESAAERGKKPSREALFALLADFAASREAHVLAVLDGVGNDDDWNAYKTPYLKLQYSQKVTADTCIEKLLFDGKATTCFQVVTNDRAITNIARGCGSRVMNVKEFTQLLLQTRGESDDILFKKKAESHGFNRPFDKLLGDSE